MAVRTELPGLLEKTFGMLRIRVLNAKPSRNLLELACDAFKFGSFSVHDIERLAECRPRAPAGHCRAADPRPTFLRSERCAVGRMSLVFCVLLLLKQVSCDIYFVCGA